MPAPDAARFGLAHAKAVAEQSVRGVHRTVPMWLVAGALLTCGVHRLRRRGRCEPWRIAAGTAAAAAGLQLLWSLGYAGVSGTRTAMRLTRLTTANVVPIEVTCPDGGPHVYAGAHHSPLADSWYVDGVFAWPRHAGGGAAVVRRLLARADAGPAALTLTALSPRVAARYRKVGFRYRLWIYFMRREPAR